MGEIFLGRLEGAAGFEKLYVIKRVLPHLADDARFRTMLVDEARIAAKMSHPNICQVYELGEDSGQLFIAMEYLEGITLLPLLRRAARAKEALPLGLVAAVLQQTCDALHYAHELTERDGTRLNVVHRDVSPANVFLTETGIVKVLDFGIAKAKDVSAHTQDGTIKGKYAYMAPEQLRSEEADRRVDVFSLAIVGFEMLALRRLFQRKTDYLTFRAVMELPIPDLGEFRPDLPPAVAATFAQALQRDPRDRTASARAFAESLQRAIGGIKTWSAAELGDYLKVNFADELRRRGTALGTVIKTRDHAAAGRTTMPVLDSIEGGGPPTQDEEDTDFPSVDTGGGLHQLERISAKEQPTPTTGSGYRIGTGSDGTGAPLTELAPAPMGAVSLPRQQRVVDNNTSAPFAIPPPPSRRGVLWPLFAIAIVAAGATALWFMWKQIKSQQPSGGIVIVDHGGVKTEGSGDDGSATTPGPAVIVAPDGSGSGSGSAAGPAASPGSGSAAVARDGSVDRPDRIPSSEKEIIAQIRGKLAGKVGAINGCVDEHRDSVAESPTMVVLTVSKTGKGSATVEPAAVNSSALGACIRRVVQAIDYGRIARDSTLRQSLRRK
jgi:hypothetical protein